MGAYAPSYVVILDDGDSAPKHVADFKIYIHFAIILCAFVSEKRME